MNLKDITLGQFFPGNSFLHRLDPRMKLLGLICYLVALFLANWFVTYGVMLALLVLGCAVAHIRPKTLLGGLKPVIVLLVFTGVLNMFYTPGTPLVSFWIFTITYEGILHAFFMVVRIMMLICATFLLTYTTSPLALTDALESLLSPLNLIRVPVHELAMIMSIALRFIPTLIEETDKIMSARRPHPQGQGPDPPAGAPVHLRPAPGGGAGHRHGVPLLLRRTGPHPAGGAAAAPLRLGVPGVHGGAGCGHGPAGRAWAVTVFILPTRCFHARA